MYIYIICDKMILGHKASYDFDFFSSQVLVVKRDTKRHYEHETEYGRKGAVGDG